MPVLIPSNDTDCSFSIVHEYQVSTKNRIIYLSTVLSVIVAFASLPFIEFPVIVNCSGAIQSRSTLSDGKLKAYCYINPSDIGKIRIGQRVSLKIDALNYSAWGMISGRITEISYDLILQGKDVALFKIQCSMDKDHFDLKGSRVYFKTGMSFKARIKVGDLSLFDLFRYKPNKPINPSLYSNLYSEHGY